MTKLTRSGPRAFFISSVRRVASKPATNNITSIIKPERRERGGKKKGKENRRELPLLHWHAQDGQGSSANAEKECVLWPPRSKKLSWMPGESTCSSCDQTCSPTNTKVAKQCNGSLQFQKQACFQSDQDHVRTRSEERKSRIAGQRGGAQCEARRTVSYANEDALDGAEHVLLLLGLASIAHCNGTRDTNATIMSRLRPNTGIS